MAFGFDLRGWKTLPQCRQERQIHWSGAGQQPWAGAGRRYQVSRFENRIALLSKRRLLVNRGFSKEFGTGKMLKSGNA
jgi:hypothetical protein